MTNKISPSAGMAKGAVFTYVFSGYLILLLSENQFSFWFNKLQYEITFF